MSADQAYRVVQRGEIQPSDLNPRKHYDPAALDELAESIKNHGILEPLLCRPVANSRLEIVAGERRWRAAGVAELDLIPVIVREMDDDQAVEAMIVENLQREDLDPIDEALGYESLTKRGYKVDELAAKIGRSKRYVYARMQLAKLPEPTLKAVRAGEMLVSVAQLVARIPDPDLQEKATADLLRNNGPENPASVGDARDWIQHNYMLRLKGCGFPPADADLVPSAGPCTTCPKRTGNQQDLFHDVQSKDVCTDPKCFRAKLDAAYDRHAASATEKGWKVLSAKECKKIFGTFAGNYPSSPWVDVHKSAGWDNRGRSRPSWWKLLKGDSAPAGLYHLAKDNDGAMQILAKEKDLHRAGIAAGHKWLEKERRQTAASSPAMKRAKREEKARRAAFATIAETVCASITSGKREFLEAADAALVRGLIESVWHDSLKRVCRRRGIDLKGKGYDGPRTALRRELGNMTNGEALALAAEIAITREADSAFAARPAAPVFDQLTRELGIKPKDHLQAELDRLKAIEAEKKARKKKPASKATSGKTTPRNGTKKKAAKRAPRAKAKTKFTKRKART